MIPCYSRSAMAMVFLSWFPRKCRAGSREAELTDRCLEVTGAGGRAGSREAELTDRCLEGTGAGRGRAGSSPWVEIDRLGHMILPIRWLVTHGLAVFVLP